MIDEQGRHRVGLAVLRKLMVGYVVIRQTMDADAVLGAEMGRDDFYAFRLLSLDERSMDAAVAEIVRLVERDGMAYCQPDPPLPITVVRGYGGVRFAMKGGGYVGPDEPDHERDIGAAERAMRHF